MDAEAVRIINEKIDEIREIAEVLGDGGFIDIEISRLYDIHVLVHEIDEIYTEELLKEDD